MNLYIVILWSVTIGGMAISAWGWATLATSRKIKQWPTVEGIIEESSPVSSSNDLLPHIVFTYSVANSHHRHTFQLPEGTHPLPEFNQSYLKKYPAGTTVRVYYNPEQPDIATIEPGAQGDWMILALGLMMALGGIIALLVA